MEARQDAEQAIDEERRRRFEAAWAAGNPLEIEDCLPAQSDAAFLPTLEELVHIELEFAWKQWFARGQASRPQETAAMADVPQPVERYLARFPQLNEPAIRARLAEQEALVRQPGADRPAARDETILKNPAGQPTNLWPPSAAASGGPSSPAGATRRLGGYELLEELGRGGMGVVYRARQLSAGRIVALKVIRGDQLAALRREERAHAVERFRQEALAAARLQHEHIVTIYEVGEAEGEPYFSMRYVAGTSLADLLCQGPLEGRRAAAYLEPVARAVASAHDVGILHRDLKPQNILIEKPSDRALVADFGLAKLLEQRSELTQAGEVMGTPSYMPPEQARDASTVTTRCDIYSLGATLYHMLTGRPPFQATSLVETLRQVQEEEPVAPSRLNRAVDRDLETICLTCLHKEPERRYASALALADDLRRYREGFPILARPAGRGERTLRWCRRNPFLAATLALAATFLLAALVASGVGYRSTATALAGKTKALQESEQSYRQSREVVNQFFTLVSEDVLLNQPGTQPLRNELLKLALDHYQRFLAQRGEDPALLEEIARTHYRVGLIQLATNAQPAAGLKSLEEALRIQRDLVARSPESESLAEALGDTLNALGSAEQPGGAEQRLAQLVAAREWRQKLAEQHQDRPEYQRKLANTIMNIGLLSKQLQRLEEAADALAAAQAIRQAALGSQTLASPEPASLMLWRDVALGHYNLANLALARKEASAAEKHLAPAIEILEMIERQAPNDLRNRERLAGCYHLAARLCNQRRDYSEAERRYRQAIGGLDVLSRNSPEVVEFRERLALAHLDHGGLQMRHRRPEAALADYTSACEHLRQIVPAPNSAEHPSRRRNYAVALRERARAQLELGESASAAALLDSSCEYLETLAQQAPDEATRQDLEDDLKQTRQLQARAKETRPGSQAR